MSLKTRLIAGVVLITLICFIDYQYFSEGMDVRKMNPLYRQCLSGVDTCHIVYAAKRHIIKR